MSVIEALKTGLAHPRIFSLFNIIIGAKRSTTIFINTYVRPHAGMRILDVGCGAGRLAYWLKGTQYTGIDISAAYIENAKKTFPWAQFLLGDICTMQVPAASVDTAIISGVLHHLDDVQCQKLLTNLSKALCDGGVLVVLEAVFVDGQHPFARWMKKNDRGEFVRWQNEYKNLLSVHFDIVESVIRHDLLNIPYTHAIFRAIPRR